MRRQVIFDRFDTQAIDHLSQALALFGLLTVEIDHQGDRRQGLMLAKYVVSWAWPDSPTIFPRRNV